MEHQNGGRLASFGESTGFSGAKEGGFSGSSSYKGGQHKKLFRLTGPQRESRENSQNRDPDEFSAIEDRSFSSWWL
jgi:hypothetical protein